MRRAVVVGLCLGLNACGFSRPADVSDAALDATSDAPGDGSGSSAGSDAAVDAGTSAALIELSFDTAENPQLPADIVATITEDEIAATLPSRQSLAGLRPRFTAIHGDVTIGAAPQVSGVTANDFSTPLVYTVTSGDGTSRSYTAHVVVADPVVPAFSLSTTAGGSLPVALAEADVNLDGLTDVVALDHDSHRVIVSVNISTAAGQALVASFTQDTHADPAAIAVGDVNLDGTPDLVVGSGNLVTVFLNTTPPGSPDLAFAAGVDFAAGTTVTSLALADFNGDGLLDIATANTGAGTVSVLLASAAPGAATPAFRTHVDFAAGTSPAAIAAGDLDGDGRADLAVVNTGDATVSVLVGTTAPGATTPAFAAQVPFGTSASPGGLAIGDLDGDGRPDLAVSNANDDTVSVLISTFAPRTFPAFAPKRDIATDRGPEGVALADVNGDGTLDLLVACHDANTLAVHANRTVPGGTVSFADMVTIDASGAPHDVIARDLDGDGRIDVASVAQVGNSVSVFHNDTPAGRAIAFRAQQDIAIDAPTATELADLDHDGKPDIVGVSGSFIGQAGQVRVFFNTTAPGSLSLTGNGAVIIAGEVGGDPDAVAIGDLNGDGTPEIVACNASLLQDEDGNVPPGGTIAIVNQSFGEPIEVPAVAPLQATMADLNLDGRPDLVALDGGIAVLFDTSTLGGTPGFSSEATVPTSLQSFNKILAADVNNDGRVDIVAVDSSNVVAVAINQTASSATAATFAPLVTFPAGSNPISFAVGDLNGDGRVDVVTTNFNSNTISILLGTTLPGSAIPTFAPQLELDVGGAPTGVALADLDGDGKVDIAVANQQTGDVTIYRNTTDALATIASFDAPVSVPLSAGAPVDLRIGDVNGDGRPDLVVQNFAASAITVLLAK